MKETPVKSIRKKCLECAGSFLAVKRCASADCPLFKYRLGRDPARKGIGGGLSNFKQKGAHSGGDLLPKKGIVGTPAKEILAISSH